MYSGLRSLDLVSNSSYQELLQEVAGISPTKWDEAVSSHDRHYDSIFEKLGENIYNNNRIYRILDLCIESLDRKRAKDVSDFRDHYQRVDEKDIKKIDKLMKKCTGPSDRRRKAKIEKMLEETEYVNELRTEFQSNKNPVEWEEAVSRADAEYEKSGGKEAALKTIMEGIERKYAAQKSLAIIRAYKKRLSEDPEEQRALDSITSRYRERAGSMMSGIQDDLDGERIDQECYQEVEAVVGELLGLRGKS